MSPVADGKHAAAGRRWVVLGVVVLAYVLSFFQRFAPAGIAPDLAAAFHTTAASLGVLAATYFYVYTVMQIPTGVLVDTLGPRRILLLGGVVSGLGSVIFGLAPSLDLALLGRTLVGLGVSVTFIAMLKIVALWFKERRFATITGVAMLVGNLGSVLAGAPLSAMAQSVGWRAVFVGVGAASLMIGLACWWLVREPQATSSATTRVDRTVILQALLSVLKNPATWPAALVVTGVSGSFFAFAGLWATPFLMQAHGLSRESAVQHLSLYFAGFAIGCLLLGTLSDYLGRRKPVMIASTHLYAVCWLVLLLLPSWPPGLGYPLFAAMGLFTASFTLSWACAKEVNPPQLSGMSTSVANMGGFLGGALLQPLVGWVMDLSWSGALQNGVRIYQARDYHDGLLLLAGFACLGAGATWWLRETRCRNIWKP